MNLPTLRLDASRPGVPDTATGLAEAVRLELPAGLSLGAPPVRTAEGRIAWRFRAERPDDHVLPIQVGDEPASLRPQRLAWARLLRRVFTLYVLTCYCGG